MWQIRYRARNVVAAIVGLRLRAMPWRFSKDYRHGVTRWNRFVYAVCNTVAANYVADGSHPMVAVCWGYPSQAKWQKRL